MRTGETGSLCVAGGTVKWCRHCGKWCDDSSKKLNKELPYDPEIPVLDMYPKKWKKRLKQMFLQWVFLVITAVFMIAKRVKPPKCPLTEEWIKKCDTYIRWIIIQP